MQRVITIAAVYLVPAIAAAEPWIIEPTPQSADNVTQGEAEVTRAQGLAKEKKYAEAVQVLEAVAQAHPASAHDCNLALAYLRNDQLTRAQLMADVAKARGGERPDWCKTSLAAELAKALKEQELVPLTVRVTPADAVIEVDGLTVRGVQLFWLPVDTYSVGAHADGYDDAQAPVVVAAPSAEVTITLEPTKVDVPPVEVKPEPEVAKPLPDPLIVTDVIEAKPAPTWPGWAGVIGGGAFLVTGAGLHLAALSTKDEANATFTDDPMFDSLSSTFARERALTVTSYVIGTAAISLGIWWLTR